MPQIICENVSLGYENRPILKDLSFTVNSGDYLSIVGENGSGKSTLMKTMLALTPPLAGCIRMEEVLTGGRWEETVLHLRSGEEQVS